MAYDIYIQPVPVDDATGLKVITFGYAGSLKVTGFYALIDRWLKTLMTSKGSDPLDKNYGTRFTYMFGGNVQDDSYLRDTVTLTIADANEQVKVQDIESFRPDNERLSDAVLLRLELTTGGDGFEALVKITNKAGEKLSISIPPSTAG